MNRNVAVGVFLALFLNFLTGFVFADPGQENLTEVVEVGDGTVQDGSGGVSDQLPAQAEAVTTTVSEGKVFTSTENLNVDPVTGTASMSIPIEVPAGRAGIQPSLSLLYNSSGSNGSLGMGWVLEAGSIQRSLKKGVPKYDSTDTFVLTQAGSTQELVYDPSAGFYRPQSEGAFMKIEFLSDKWIATDKKGVTYYFGQTNASRQLDPDNQSRIFKWCLDRAEDLNGNYMSLTYTKNGQQIYPDEILYTGNSDIVLPVFASVKFEYEPRSDYQWSTNMGFMAGINIRLKSVSVKAENNLMRKYTLNYAQDPESGKSLLQSLSQIGSDGVSALPQTTFSYSQGNTDMGQSFDVAYSPNVNINAGSLRIIDVNGDGLPDALKSAGGGAPYQIYTNNGGWGFSPPVNTTNNPAQVFDANFQIVDLNNDGFPDIVYGTPGDYRVWPNNGQNDFQPSYPLSHHPEAWLSDASVRFLDMNGDGRPDLVKSYGTNQPYYIFFNLPSGDFGPVVTAANPPSPGLDNPDMRIADFNGDGLADIIYGTSCPYTIWLNNGTNGFLPARTVTQCPNMSISHQNLTQLVDLNADGLVDMLTSEPGANIIYRVYLNNGKTDFYAPFDAANPPRRATNDPNVKLMDFNGDGLTDVVVGEPSAGIPYQVSLGDGYGGFRPARIFSYGFSTDLDDWSNMLIDFNGDGLVDFLRGVGTDGPYKLFAHMWDNNSAKSNVLTGVDNGMGAQTTVSYTQYPIVPLSPAQYKFVYSPVNFNAVKRVTTNVQSESYRTNYVFKNCLWNYPSREFRGFSYAKVIDPNGNYSETRFLQDDIYKGRPSSQETYDASGNLYGKTVNTWSYQDIAPGVKFVHLYRKDNFVYDGDATGRRTAELYFYGESPQLGNLTRAVSLGEVDLTSGDDIGSDKRTVETEYLNNTQNGNWLVGFPMQTRVKNNYEELVRQSSFYYDGQLTFGALPVKGFLTKKQDWGGDGLADISPVVQYTYDDYGNLETTEDPDHNITTVAYDLAYHMFPVTTINALNHEITNTYYGVGGTPLDGGDGYRGLWGQLKSTTDPNNQEGRKTYDTFGRVVATVSPLDSVNYPMTSVEYALTAQGAIVKTHTREKHGQSGTVDSIQFYDGLGRLIQAKSESETAGQYVVSGQTQYNSRGLPEKKYLPKFSTNAMDSIDPINPTDPHTTITYDAMGRAVQTTNPDGTYASAIYDDWSNASINENGHKQKSYFDSYGRLIKKEEYTGADGRSPDYPASAYTLYATTNYSYDSEGNLTQVQDDAGNITTVAYNNLGRKVSMADPDMGAWQYEYDASGNLKVQTDSKAQVLQFNYDALNRLVNKNNATAYNVNYTFDDPVVDYSKGRLTAADYDLNADTEFAYDQVGRENLSIKKIDGLDYAVTRSYDAVNRLATLTLPDQSQVFYTYNAAGQIETVANGPEGAATVIYVTNVDYNASGQMTKIEYGNGDVTTYTYDPVTLRLSRMVTLNPDPYTLLQDFAYTYDCAGNIKSITDAAHTATQSFQYDALNRLIQATGGYGTKAYAYDTIGNLTLKDGISYNYGENGYGPHAVTSGSDGSVFRYDNNGNMIQMVKGGVTQDYTYDVENRLSEVKKSSQLLAKFEYDGDGGRTKKTTYTYSSSGGGGGCFLSGTPVLMADGTTKAIEDIKAGDEVMGFDEKAMKNVSAKVSKTFAHEDSTDEYLIINDRLRVTVNHQFFSKGNWLRADNLKFADVLLGSDSQDVAISKIERIKEKSKVDVYNIEVDSAHNYYVVLNSGYQPTADSSQLGAVSSKLTAVLVHNKIIPMRMEAGFFKNPYVNYALDAISSFIGVTEAEAATTVTSKTTKFVGSLYEVASDEGRTTSHVFLGDMKIASIVNGQALYYHSDHLGSTNVLSDSNGVVKELMEYMPFGSFSRHEKYGTAQEVAEFYFTGQRYDDETGLYYYGARYYDPVIGKFLTPDTVVQAPSNPQTLNRYSYTSNNPVNRVDPSGHSWFSKFFGKVFGAVAGIATSIFTGNVMLGFQVFNMIDSTFTAGMTGNWGGFAGGLGGGILGGMAGVGLAGKLAGWLGESAFTFGGGFLVGATEFGVAGFGAGLGGALGSGADINDALVAGGIGFGTGALVGGVIEGSYLAGWQDTLHGMSREQVFESSMKRYNALARKAGLDSNLRYGNRPLGGQKGHPANHAYLDNEKLHFEMGPDSKTRLIEINGENSMGTTSSYLKNNPGSRNELTVKINQHFYEKSVDLYRIAFVGTQYNAFSHNSNFAAQQVLYGSGGPMLDLRGFDPGFPDFR